MSTTNGKHHPKPYVVHGATHVEVADLVSDGKVQHKTVHQVELVQDATAITAKIGGVWLSVVRWLRNGQEVKADA
jgi:hypothetical protein